MREGRGYRTLLHYDHNYAMEEKEEEKAFGTAHSARKRDGIGRTPRVLTSSVLSLC